MQKRARLLDNKMKRIHINRRGRTEYKDSLSLPLAYMRLTLCWLTIVTLGAFTGFRVELLWPFWLMIRAAYESMHKSQHPVASLANPNTTKFSVFFVCVTATSDLICYLFIPVRMLIFIATTYVWINLIWHTHGGFIRTVNTMYNGEKSQSGLILVLTALVIGFELFLRVRFDYYMQINRGEQGSSLPIFWTNTVSPALPRSLNGFFGSHCIGYPVVLVTFSLQYYFNEWKMRRRQSNVCSRNEQLYRILVESLPSDYEGPKDYSTSCLDDDCYFDTAPIAGASSNSTSNQPMAAITAGGGGGPYTNNGTPTQTTNSKKNGYNKGRGGDQKRGGAKKNGNLPTNGTPPEKKTKDQNETNNNGYDSDDECCWNGASSSKNEYSTPSESKSRGNRRGGISVIRILLDFSIWVFSGIGSALIGSSRSINSDSTSNNNNGTSKRAGAAAASSRKKKNCDFIDDNTSNYYEDNCGDKLQNGRMPDSSTSNNNGTVGKKVSTNNRNPIKTRMSVKPTTSTKSDKQQEMSTNSEHNEVEIYTREIEDLRCELNTKRNIEEDMKLTIRMLESNESRLSQTISHLRMRLDQMENKCNSLEKHRETDKASLEQADAKYTALSARKVELEQALIAERKARNEDTGKKMDLAEHQREKERQLEKEVDRLRVELKIKEESNCEYEAELVALRRYKEKNDIDEIRMETKILKDKSSHLESSLASENKLKQELFRALGDAKASNKYLEKRVNDLEAELRTRPQIVDDDTTNSDQSSPHQNNSAMGSPIPPSTKGPLSINIMNRETPNKLISPIGSKIGGGTGGLVGISPPDYHMAMNHSKPPPAINNFGYRYNQFQPHSSTGEHMLFDTPPSMSNHAPANPVAAISTANSTVSSTSCAPSDLSRHMGKFGAPSNPITRTN